MDDDGKSVLIVEDEPGIRRLILEALSDSGFNCIVAEDAEEALRKASVADVVAAVLDLNLPGVSGAELAWHLTKIVPDAHLIAVSGFLEDWEAGDLRDLGIETLIPKPCDMDELVSALREALSQPGELSRGRYGGAAISSPDCAR